MRKVFGACCGALLVWIIFIFLIETHILPSKYHLFSDDGGCGIEEVEK